MSLSKQSMHKVFSGGEGDDGEPAVEMDRQLSAPGANVHPCFFADCATKAVKSLRNRCWVSCRCREWPTLLVTVGA